MRNGLIAMVALACFATSGCAVNTVFRCVDHPFVCASIGAGVAGSVFLWRQGYFENQP